jgi:hypothetical protein
MRHESVPGAIAQTSVPSHFGGALGAAGTNHSTVTWLSSANPLKSETRKIADGACEPL